MNNAEMLQLLNSPKGKEILNQLQGLSEQELIALAKKLVNKNG